MIVVGRSMPLVVPGGLWGDDGGCGGGNPASRSHTTCRRRGTIVVRHVVVVATAADVWCIHVADQLVDGNVEHGGWQFLPAFGRARNPLIPEWVVLWWGGGTGSGSSSIMIAVHVLRMTECLRKHEHCICHVSILERIDAAVVEFNRLPVCRWRDDCGFSLGMAKHGIRVGG